MMLRGISRAAVLAATVLVMGAAGSGRAETLSGGEVISTDMDGRSIGCEFLFEIAREPGAPDAQRSINGDIGILTSGSRWGAILKIRRMEAGRPLAAPTMLLMATGEGDNKGEFGGAIDTDDTDYALTTFKPGPLTQGALGDFARDGVIGLLVLTDDGRRETWTLDVSSRPDLRQAWVRCLAEFPALPGAVTGRD